ncbi:MAG: hypothetical protein IPG75_21870 [Gemmatimonadetes bacterium]|nr:hypothetical protein [Gemmatimonadota bacterium]
MGEMLEGGGNPWRGMTFGMTARLPWAGDPTGLWRLWDDFGIQQSRLMGWWSGRDPVTTSDPDVLATTWIRPGAAMVALGSWRDDSTTVRLTLDWAALGLDPARTRIRAPAVSGFRRRDRGPRTRQSRCRGSGGWWWCWNSARSGKREAGSGKREKGKATEGSLRVRCGPEGIPRGARADRRLPPYRPTAYCARVASVLSWTTESAGVPS